MPELEIRFLGGFEVSLNGHPVTAFESDKARALLAYLATEAGRPHRREVLSGLLWPELAESSARMNLRGALSNLRRLIPDGNEQEPRLQTSRQAIQFDANASDLVDVQRFDHLTAEGAVRRQPLPQLEQAVELYRGEFLHGLSLPDATEFEAWLIGERARLARQVADALQRLAEAREQGGAYETALRTALRLVDLEPLEEGAHRQVMRLQVHLGRRAEALHHYQELTDLLRQELSVDPAPETYQLAEEIRSGRLKQEPGGALGPIRGYQLRNQIGNGSFGAVYRGYQPAVGREVAIKVILPEHANHPEFIRRFEAEAQVVAQIEHPHVVPLFDYWREPSGAYLVMRLLRGGSLKDSLRAGPWDLLEAARLAEQVGAALTAAHRKGVVHRDLKPANILLDEANNAYLGDFGIAWDLDSANTAPAAEGFTGSPAYISPEQIRGESVSPQSDIYSFGVVLFELVTGRHPFAGASASAMLQRHLDSPLPSAHELDPALPPGLDQVIWRATSKPANGRYSEVGELVRAFRIAAGSEAPGEIAPQVPARDPYKGLRPFLEADSADFHGRDQLIERLLEALQADQPGNQLLALVGPSGSGKSSLLHAGLIPALRAGRANDDGGWYIAATRPGPDPFEALGQSLRGLASGSELDLPALLESGPDGLAAAAEAICGTSGRRMLLAIDQFEELFTLCADEELRARFVEALVHAAHADGRRFRTVITLRADHYDKPLGYPALGEQLRSGTELVLPLTPAEMRQAIEAPAAQAGLELEPGLADRILSDLEDEPGRLPLLQYTLTELYSRKAGTRLTLSSYEEMGTARGALAHRSEQIYTELGRAEQARCRSLFLELVLLSEQGEPRRRRVLRRQLVGESSEAAEAILERFGQSRLLTFDRDPESREPTVELAHEAYLEQWPRLGEWIQADQENLRLKSQLSAASRDWQQAQRDPSYLLRGNRLGQFEEWLNSVDPILGPAEGSYLEASLAAREENERLDQARSEREAETERKAFTRLRSLVVVLTIALVGGAALTAFALRARNNAEREALFRATQQSIAEFEAGARATQQALAEQQALALATQQVMSQISAGLAEQEARKASSRELALLATTNLQVDPERSILLGLRAAEVTLGPDGVVLPEAVSAIHQALQASRAELTLNPANSIDFSPDGMLLATAGPDRLARIWDAQTGELLYTLQGHFGPVARAVFSPDGTRLITTSADQTAVIWELSGRRILHRLEGHTEALLTPAWSPDGSMVVTTSADGTARLWDVETGIQLHVLPHSGVTAGPDFSPDGRRVAIADDEATVVRIWDVASGTEVLTIAGHTEGVNEAAFSPDGSLLATAGSDLTAKIWDASTGELVRTLTGHTGWVFSVDFDPGGTRVATGSEDGTAIIWDVSTGQPLLTLAGHSSGIGRVRFNADGTRLGTASGDGTAKVWDITPQGSRDWLTLAGHSDVVLDIAFSPDGSRLADASWDGTAKVWDTTTGGQLLTLAGHTDQLGGVRFSPDGRLIATASYDGTVKIWDATSGAELRSLDVGEDWLTGLAFTPSGDRLLASGLDGVVTIWQVDSGRQLDRIDAHDDWVFRLAINPAGNWLATAGWDGLVKLWELDGDVELATLVDGTDGFNSVAFNPAGDRLAAGGSDGTVRMWDLAGWAFGTPDAPLPTQHSWSGHHGIVWSVAFSPDGSTLASVSFDNTVKLWDASAGTELLTLSPPTTAGLPSVAFSPDGRLLAASSGDGTVRIFLLPTEELLELARTRLTRSWTDQECVQYLGLQSCPAGP